MANPDIKNLSLKELEDFFKSRKQPVYRARQIFSWVFKRGAQDFKAMSDLPEGLRGLLKDNFRLSGLELIKKESSLDGTGKFLFGLEDKNMIESAIIPTLKRKTACLSSQAGCKFKCGFCASGISGWARDLTVAEILSQVMALSKDIAPARISHIVFMGTGEPLDNYQNVIKAIRIINSPLGLGIAARRITISTSGIIPGIEKLSGEKLQVELSVSLHAADNATRDKLMPVNKKYPLDKLIAACRRYALETKRQVTFEYVLIKGVNSGLDSAANFTKLLRGWECKVNLIPYNPVKEFSFEPPAKLEGIFFYDHLVKNGIKVTMRSARGRDIQAACGQLRYHNRPGSRR